MHDCAGIATRSCSGIKRRMTSFGGCIWTTEPVQDGWSPDTLEGSLAQGNNMKQRRS